jgi:parallel beta-helix repeat protein
MLTREETKADSATINFDSYALGDINGQDGWSKTGPFDVAVVDLGSGNHALRVSNAVTSGSFGDQTFSKSLLNHAGETHATHGGLSGGTLQNHFEVSWDLKSATGAAQAGLVNSFSPDRGDGARMSYFRVEDSGSGFNVFFDDVQQPGPCTPLQCANFVESQVATNLNYTSWHNLKLVIDFKDGPANDIVRAYVNGVLVHTGTTWEDYFRYDPEAGADPHTHTVDSLLIRAGGSSVPANAGNGFLIDNLNLLSSTVPDPAPSTTVVQAANLTAPGGGGWLFYDDNTDTYNNTPGVLGSFVTGPAGQPLGSGSAEVTIGAGGRTNLSTYQFAGTPLESITQLGWGARTTSAGDPSYLVVNVDFNLSDTWQRRLVFVPTGVVANTWQAFDAIQGGAAQWVYSGGTWPAPNAIAGPKTWNQILADYPNARIRVSDAHVGIRTGNPGPAETTNIDRFVFGTDIAVKIFDFEPTAPCTTVCYVNAATGNDLNDGASAGTAKKTIQAAMVAVSVGGTINVAAGTYNEDVSFTKNNVQLKGAGIDQSYIVGPIGGSFTTVDNVANTGVLIDGFTITRAGNNAVDWNNPNLNSNGVSFGTGNATGTLQNSKITGNRNGILLEGTAGVVIQNNTIDSNRTGIHVVNVNSNVNIHNNFITNNWTIGVLFRSDTVPSLNTSSGTLLNNNNISGNWASQIEARGVFANTINAEYNWLGTVSPTTANQLGSGEGTYTSQVPPNPPVFPASPTASIVYYDTINQVDFDPWLCSGNDTSPAIGFQPQVGCGDIVVTTNTANVGDTVTVQVIANSVANLYGVQAFLQYDSSKLNFSGITLGPGLAPEFGVSMSQPGNQINFAFTQQAPTLPVSGSGIVLATLQFTATAPGVAAVEFRTTPQTLFSDNNGFSIGPANRTNGSITVSAPAPTGSVTGNILLQGRSNHSGASADIDPAVITPFAGSPTTLTSLSGAFTLSSVSTGSHTIQGRMLGYLLASKSITVAAGANSAGTVTLLGGDANMDQVINILDLSYIAARYLQSGPVYTPPAPSDTTPDINGDNVVNILDLSLTASNYLKTSVANPWP